VGKSQVGTSIDTILHRQDHDEPSVFLPAHLLREARRQRTLPDGAVPPICLLDPDGDVVRHLRERGHAHRSPVWACYHTELWETTVGEERIGIVGCAVGAPFAVLVAEQLFVSGCELLVSVSSAGRIAPDLPSSCVVLIEEAIRGEGTSGAYLPPADVASIDPALCTAAANGLARAGIPVIRGKTWTTDAPYRETESAIAAAVRAGVLAVEMEAAALYAFAKAQRRAVVCFAHVTNGMAQTEGEFEKGPDDGLALTLGLVTAAAEGWRRSSNGTAPVVSDDQRERNRS
jgi:uridine phosphorylase